MDGWQELLLLLPYQCGARSHLLHRPHDLQAGAVRLSAIVLASHVAPSYF